MKNFFFISLWIVSSMQAADSIIYIGDLSRLKDRNKVFPPEAIAVFEQKSFLASELARIFLLPLVAGWVEEKSLKESRKYFESSILRDIDQALIDSFIQSVKELRKQIPKKKEIIRQDIKEGIKERLIALGLEVLSDKQEALLDEILDNYGANSTKLSVFKNKTDLPLQKSEEFLRIVGEEISAKTSPKALLDKSDLFFDCIHS